MKLLEALEILRKPVPDEAAAFNVLLACGFTPLYLKTYVHAHLRQVRPGHSVDVKTGIFGDLAGELERATEPDGVNGLHGCVVVVEWADLDERLGYRSAGGWRVGKLAEVQENVARSLERLAAAIERVADGVPVVVSTPTLAIAPASFHRPDHGSRMFWDLERAVAEWALRLAAHQRIMLLNPRWLDTISPVAERADSKSNLAAGYPYSLTHTEVLASSLTSLLVPVQPAKALITDLDDTLWSGILGEVGVEGIQWTLEHRAQAHGLYQQFLQSLADAGILVGVASKNDPELVNQVWRDRTDVFVELDALFPREVSWGVKSESVTRILQAWNIGADAVIFVDDSPMEVAEVMAAHPGIRGIVFPKHDPAAVINLLTNFRFTFGKWSISEEDKLRSSSLRATARGSDEGALNAESASGGFLGAMNAVIRIDPSTPPRDGRALELVNKTNQFNLNGLRYTESEWDALLRRPGAFLYVVSYEDRFGPLGRISVLAGEISVECIPLIHTWVMSCRAFSRRIEHACLRRLFEHLGVTTVQLRFCPTSRNGPLQQFLRSIGGDLTGGDCILDRQHFDLHCPPLYHEVVVDIPAKAIRAS